MANVINTNISSLNAQRNLSTSQSSLATSLQRLSTGLRINSAKDDAAGQAISTRMTAQISGMQQASRNANDGISMSQTAEGAMGSINDILLRMRDLSVQSSNGTNGTAERATIQNEVTQLYEEIDRISGSTDFNGIKLLDGSAKSNSFQIGANAGQTISFGIKEVSTKSMNLAGSAGQPGELSSARIKSAVGANLTNSSLSINGTSIAFTAATDDSATEFAAAINKHSGATGVTASASNVVTGTSGATGVLDGTTDSISITVQNQDGTNGAAIPVAGSKDMKELVANINASVAGVTASLDDKGALSLTSENGAKININASTEAAAKAAGLDAATVGGKDYEGTLKLTSKDGSAIKLGGNNLHDFGFNPSAGAGTVNGIAASSAALVGGAEAAVTNLNASSGLIDTSKDKVKINGVELNQDAFASAFTAGEKAQAINAASGQTGVTATARTDAYLSFSDTTVAGDKVVINGKTYDLTADDAVDGTTAESDLATKIQDSFKAGTSNGVNAEIKDGKLHLISTTGADIVVGGQTAAANTGTTNVSATAAATGVPIVSGAAGVDTTVAIRGTISLSSESGDAIKLEDGTSGAGLKKLGLVEQLNSSDPSLGGKLDVSTAKGAQDAIGRIDKALSFVAEQRSNMGAVQNRLSTTISNLATATENASSARSRIQDTDFATETANMTRGQILQQAGTAMLAQANSLPNGVLSLLRG